MSRLTSQQLAGGSVEPQVPQTCRCAAGSCSPASGAAAPRRFSLSRAGRAPREVRPGTLDSALSKGVCPLGSVRRFGVCVGHLFHEDKDRFSLGLRRSLSLGLSGSNVRSRHALVRSQVGGQLLCPPCPLLSTQAGRGSRSVHTCPTFPSRGVGYPAFTSGRTDETVVDTVPHLWSHALSHLWSHLWSHLSSPCWRWSQEGRPADWGARPVEQQEVTSKQWKG